VTNARLHNKDADSLLQISKVELSNHYPSG
jgi:hypothetical protein